MREALWNFIKACWEYTSIPSLAVGVAAGYYGQGVYDFAIALLPGGG